MLQGCESSMNIHDTVLISNWQELEIAPICFVLPGRECLLG